MSNEYLENLFIVNSPEPTEDEILEHEESIRLMQKEKERSNDIRLQGGRPPRKNPTA